jgi:Mg-chelatase subunit ChlD
MQFAHPVLLLLLLLPLWFWRVARTSPVPIRPESLWCRTIVAVLLIAAASGLRVRLRDNQVTVMFVLDRSASVSAEAQHTELLRVNAMSGGMRAADRAGVVAFGSVAVLERRPGVRADLSAVAAAVGDDGTDIETAIKTAENALPREGLRRIVLLSDGRETTGDAAREAARAGADGIPIDVAPIEDEPAARRPAIVHVSAPDEARPREPFSIIVDASGAPGGHATIRVARDGQPPVTQLAVFGTDGSAQVTFSDTLRDPGVYAYRADIGDDQTGSTNDTASQAGVLVSVLGPPRVLYVSRGPGAIASLLSSGGFSVTSVTPASLPASAGGLLSYDEVVLDDVAPDGLSPAQASAIANHVEQAGGGLLVLGSAQSLTPAGYKDGPLGRVLPIDLRQRTGTRAPAMALVVIFDKSGSMADRADGVPKIELARDAAVAVLDVLPKTDSLGVIAFDAAPVTVAPLGPLPDATALADRLRAIEPGGSTALAPPVQVALDWLRASSVDPSRRFILLVSDGRSTPADIDKLHAELRNGGARLSVVAIGADADRPMLESLARETGGRAYFPDDARELPGIVARDATRSAGGGVVNEPFVLRSMPHPISAGLNALTLPRLGGYVVSAARPGAETPLVSPQDDPVLATWQSGLGRVGVFTSDLASPWTASFHTWSGFSRVWTQCARWLARAGSTGGLRARIEDTTGGPRLIVDAERDGAFANGLTVRADVRSPHDEIRTIALEQTAPGRYEAAVPAADSGPYVTAVTARDADSHELRLLRGFYRSADREHRAIGADLPALERLARASGGDVLPESGSPFDRTRAMQFHDAWSWLAFAALMVFLIDLVIRRRARFSRSGSSS